MTSFIATAEYSLPVRMCRYFRWALLECPPLLAVGEHGRHLWKDPSSRGGSFFRCRLPGGLAGEQNEEKVPGLEEKAVAGKTQWDSEEAGVGLMGKVKPTS